jgi:thiol-disulfide isomerase/thioredoxin
MATVNVVKNFSGQNQLELHPSIQQLQTAYGYMNSIASFNELTADDITKLKAECPELSGPILQQNDDLLKRIEEAKHSTAYKIVNIDDNLEGADIFKALIAPYKGKPLLVDFWATWCGPCKAAMKTILPVKEALAGKVNFIYVTGPSSPKKTWEMTIPDIHGDHYYVTEKQYSALLQQFESNGIPTYVIVDKEGNVKNKYIGYPGNEVMEEQLK